MGLVSSLFQREMFVSTMGTIYNVQEESAGTTGRILPAQTRPRRRRSGLHPAYRDLLMIYYVLAMQCLSTVAVMRRETGGWRWPLFQIAYMSGLAYGSPLVVYRRGPGSGRG